jgi:hypothetical protein
MIRRMKFPNLAFFAPGIKETQLRPKRLLTTLNMALLSATGISFPGAVLVLVTSLLLGACAATDTGKKDDPVFFGTARGANGGGGATSGMSFSW